MNARMLLQWNRWQFLLSQLTLISVLFLYVVLPPASGIVIALIGVVLLATILSQLIGASLYDMVDQARLRGDFRVIRKTMMIHLLHWVIVMALILGVYRLAMQFLGLLAYVDAGSVVLVLVGLDKLASTTLRAQATPVILQAHAIRRTVLIVVLGTGVLVRNEDWFDTMILIGIMSAVLGSIVRLFIGHIQFYKEARFRRQFEDSGAKRSVVSLIVELAKRYGTAMIGVALPLGFVLMAGILFEWVLSPQRPATLTPSLLFLIAMFALARTMMTTLLPDTSQWQGYVNSANHSILRESLSRLQEQVMYRSLILATVWFASGILLGPSVTGSVASLLATTAVVLTATWYLVDQRLLRLATLPQQAMIVLMALLVFGLNSWLLSIYYPELSLLIGFVLSTLWIHLASLMVWTTSFDLELKVHVNQVGRMILVIIAVLVLNGGIYWLLGQFPLGVDPLVEQLVFFSLFAIITSVVMYSLTYALGIHRSLQSKTELLHQLTTQFMDYEEEEAIW